MYLSEYASPRVRRRLKPIIETLASIPSVVLGYFALQVINPQIVQNLMGASSTFTIMAAGIGVGILTIPLVATVAEDAMHAVPAALREAAYGIGAKRRTVTIRVVFPAAISGVVAGADPRVLPRGRRDDGRGDRGGRHGPGARAGFNPLQPGQTMTGAISSLAIGSDSVKTTGAGGVNPFDALYFVGLLLFVDHVRAQPGQRAVRPPRAEELLMSTLASLDDGHARERRGRAPRDEARHRRDDLRRADAVGAAALAGDPARAALLDAAATPGPCSRTRGADFVTSDTSRIATPSRRLAGARRAR